MAVHNSIKYLKESIESILNQSYADFEFIIIDDGSTDGSTDLLREYAIRDARIRLYIQENIGLTKSLNKGLSLARGEFIARMDSDDLAMPHRFNLQINEFKNHCDLVLVGSEVGLIDEGGIRFTTWGQTQDPVEIRRKLLLGDGGVLIHPAVMFRSESARMIGGYDENMPTAQDLDLYLRLTEKGLAMNIPKVLLLWRQHSASVNHTKSHTWVAMRQYCIGKTIKRIGVERYLKELFLPSPKSIALEPIQKARLAANANFYYSATLIYLSIFRKKGGKIKALKSWFDMILLLGNRFFWGLIRKLLRLHEN